MTADSLATPRFDLQLLTGRADHAALFRALYTCPQVMARIGPPLDVATADAAFARACAHNTKSAPGHRYWAIQRREGASCIGLVALQPAADGVETGVMLARAWQRRGVAGEVWAAVVGHGFTARGAALIYARSRDGDQRRVLHPILTALGFTDVHGPAIPPGECRWEIDAPRWATRPAVGPI